LALSLQKGSSFSYAFSLTMDMTVSASGQTQPVKANMAGTLSWHVVSVDAKGIASVDLSMSNMSGDVNGRQLPPGLAQSQNIHMRIGPDGRVISGGDLTLAAGGSTGFGLPGGGQFVPLLPPKNVHPGDTWDSSFDQSFPFGGQKVHIDSHSSFLRYESIHGVNAAVTQTAVSLPVNLRLSFEDILKVTGGSAQAAGLSPDSHPVFVYTGQASSNGTGWLDPDKGELIKDVTTMRMQFKIDIQGLAPADINPGEPTSFDMAGSMKVSLDRR
jgi:hypothetical protein